jgi:DNA topoisomerase VI subunit B
MQQVLTNLVANSIHYGKENGTSTLKLKDNGRDVTLSVADDGIGIAADDLDRIFERFYRVDKSRSRHAGGSGLGLSIVKHIIESHGQEISVASEPGQGTTFSWNLVNLDWEAEKLNPNGNSSFSALNSRHGRSGFLHHSGAGSVDKGIASLLSAHSGNATVPGQISKSSGKV